MLQVSCRACSNGRSARPVEATKVYDEKHLATSERVRKLTYASEASDQFQPGIAQGRDARCRSRDRYGFEPEDQRVAFTISRHAGDRLEFNQPDGRTRPRGTSPRKSEFTEDRNKYENGRGQLVRGVLSGLKAILDDPALGIQRNQRERLAWTQPLAAPVDRQLEALALSHVEACLERSELEARPYALASCDWEEVWSALDYQPVAASRAMLDYQHAYRRGAGWQFADISLVLMNDGRPCGLWPLTFGGPGGALKLSSAGAPVQAPLFVAGLSPRTVKRITSRAIGFVRAITEALGLPELMIGQLVDPATVSGGMTEWHQQWMAAGGMPALCHELFVDLRPDMADIRASFRKSYRPLINVGLRIWTVEVMEPGRPDATAWQEFRQLHLEVAGRITRNDETWSQQLAMVASGDAFLVSLRDPATGRMVGAGFFQLTRDEGFYAVAAYDRSQFDKPLGHVLQQVAIEQLKARGLRWYRIGHRPFAQDRPAPTGKQLTISAFKQGFASHCFSRTELRWTPDTEADTSLIA